MKKENYINNANRFINEQEESFPQERIEDIVMQATEAFFDKVAELCPEITTGDFDPMDSTAFDKAAEAAVRAWINSNISDNDPVM